MLNVNRSMRYMVLPSVSYMYSHTNSMKEDTTTEFICMVVDK